jgi:hypothetical protein
VKENALPYAVLSVCGFSDSPVSWKDQTHGFYNSGQNHYTFILFPDNRYWLFKSLGTFDLK